MSARCTWLGEPVRARSALDAVPHLKQERTPSPNFGTDEPGMSRPILVVDRMFNCYNPRRLMRSVLPSHSSRTNCRRSRWSLFVIFLAIFALTATLATRTSVPTDFHGTIAQSASTQATRQHLDGDAIQWVAPTPVLTALQVPSFYPRFSPAGPPLPNLLFDESLYNRPPPSC